MKAARFEGTGILNVIDLPEPVPTSKEVRLRVLQAGICATDLHILQGHFPVQPPRVLGHELSGVVDAVGEDISPDWLGKICGVRPARFCGTCSACQNGYPELCFRFECLGNTRDGGYAEAVLVPEDQLVWLPGVQPEKLVWLEPLACVLHALDACHAGHSRSVLITGAGVLGRLMVLVLKATSSARIAVADPNPEKVSQALSLGAQKGWVVPHSGEIPQIDEEIQSWDPDGISAVIDTSGSPAAIERAIRWAGMAGQVLLFGVSDPAAHFPLYPEVIFRKELHLSAASGMTPRSFDQAVELLRSDLVDPTSLVSEIIDLKQVPEIIRDRTRMSAGKILIQPGRKN